MLSAGIHLAHVHFQAHLKRSAVKWSKVDWESARWQMGELDFLLFWGHGHLEECSTICPMSLKHASKLVYCTYSLLSNI